MSRSDAGIRLHVEDDLGPGAALALTPAQAHYLGNVMRLGVGDELLLFNGRDGEWRATIDGQGKGSCAVSVTGRARPQSRGPDLWLVFAPIKRARIDFLAEKATELGVAALVPVFTRRTVVRRVNTARLRAHAVEAAEQSGRLDVPEVREARPLAELIGSWPEGRRVLVCDESGGGAPIAEVLAQAPGPRGGAPWALLVGPEGGFDPSELDALRKLPFVTLVGLGPRLLRADTAALAALACWQALAGDWRPAPDVSMAREA